MKHPAPFLLAAATLVAASSVHAATATKTGTAGSTDLTDTTGVSWIGGSGTGGSPASTDVATWTTASLGAGLTVGSDVTWSSINVGGALTNIDISGAGKITTGNITLTGSQTLSIANNLALSGNSTYSIADVTGSAASDAILSGVISDGGSAFGLTKSGAGTLDLSGANSYTGTTTISAGTLALSGGDNRLATAGTVNFSAAGTLNIDSTTNQSLANLTVANGITGTVTGTGTLNITGGAFLIGNTAGSSAAQTLNMVGLTAFDYNNSTGAFNVGGGNVATVTNSGTLSLAQTSIITAASFKVASVNTAGTTNGIVNLGQTTTINADEIEIGATLPGSNFGHDNGTLQFQALTGPTLTLRGTAGGGSRVVTMNVGQNNSGTGYLGKVDLTTGVTAGSTLDAMIGTLTIGINSRGISATGALSGNGSFAMGGGILDVTTLVLGSDVAGTTATGACTAVGTFTLGVSGGIAGGTVKVQTLKFADKLSSGTDVVTATFNLNNGGTIAAQSIQSGAFGGGSAAVKTLNWNDGTIKNYDSSTDLTISGLTTFALAATGTHAFDISANRTGTVNQVISGSGALTKLDSGILIFAAANTYTGATTVSNGTLNIASTGSINVGASGVTVASGATLAVDGKLVLTSTTQGLIVNSAGTVALTAGSAVLDLNNLFNGATAGQTYTLITGGGITGNFNSFANYTGGLSVSFDNTNGTITFAAVPEPSTYGLMGAGALAAVAMVRRRRKLAGKTA